ncbi:MAG: SUMF1/EgtB/PvdO family nonheme iron enzyme [Planctomycetes bacterium]|nr:SUMF1/EgtB/PvdO family nonheme iron enzyme [Planctomycetota bacterium]
MSSRVLEILDLPAVDREVSAREVAAEFPDHAAAIGRLIEHARAIEDAEAMGIQTPPLERLEKLRKRTGPSHRYESRWEVTRGGMGIIKRVWDDDLGRCVAMKVMRRSQGGPLTEGGTQPTRLERFIAEAQVTSQLDHPGVIPVYDVGIDEEGAVYFTMPFVKGRTAHDIFRLARENANGFDLTRALEVLLKVCDTLAFAHARGVVHRDVKPSNVMVGRFGEVYVMDWGLAKVRGQADRETSRPTVGDGPVPTVIQTDRIQGRQRSVSTTQDGTILGTPSYMSPEQGFGRIDEVGPATDVYAVGAMIYTLLTDREPYVEPGVRPSLNALLDSLLEGPPRPVVDIDPKAPVELVSICEKAMARKVAHRYASMTHLSEDLRAFLSGRVVRAHRTGPIAELRKWIARNRAVALMGGVAILTLIVGLLVSLYFYGRELVSVSESRQLIAELHARSTGQELADLVDRVDDLWPLVPDRAPRIEAWLRDAQELVDRIPAIESVMRRVTNEPSASDPERQRKHTLRLATLENILQELVSFREGMPDPRDRFHLVGGTFPDVVRRRDALALVGKNQAEAEWRRIGKEIANDQTYGGLELEPQWGLIPLGRNPRTGLQEFWHVLSGTRPEPNPGFPDEHPNRWMVSGETGLVFVLIPGGSFDMGASSNEGASGWEQPVQRDVRLSPFFLSKYEMTQGQWTRLMRSNPSFLWEGHQDLGVPITSSHPVEKVTWDECDLVLSRLSLDFPTEAQWEYACRAGQQAPWWTGGDPRRLADAENVLEAMGAKLGTATTETADPWNDGYGPHAPVGSYRANPFGLHDVHGNVMEWCRDVWARYGDAQPRPGDGLMIRASGTPPSDRDLSRHTHRGGAWTYTAAFARSSIRSGRQRDENDAALGVRPFRALMRSEDPLSRVETR